MKNPLLAQGQSLAAERYTCEERSNPIIFVEWPWRDVAMQLAREPPEFLLMKGFDGRTNGTKNLGSVPFLPLQPLAVFRVEGLEDRNSLLQGLDLPLQMCNLSVARIHCLAGAYNRSRLSLSGRLALERERRQVFLGCGHVDGGW